MSRGSVLARSLGVLLLVLGAGCSSPTDTPSPKATAFKVYHFWQFFLLTHDWNTTVFSSHTQEGGVVSERHDFGETLPFRVSGRDSVGKGEVFSNEAGDTYWVESQAPFTASTTDDIYGAGAELMQFYYYAIDSAQPSIKFTVTKLKLEMVDADATAPSAAECRTPDPATSCNLPIGGQAIFGLWAIQANGPDEIFSTEGYVELAGYHGNWSSAVGTADGDKPAFKDATFRVTRDPSGSHATLELEHSLSFTIPTTGLHPGDTVLVRSKVRTWSYDNRQKETFSGAYLRDPVSPVAVSVEAQGAHLVTPRPATEQDFVHVPQPAPACSGGSNANAGTLQFSAPQFSTPEGSFFDGRVTVTRTGGTSGFVSAVVTTGGGSATPGTDYDAVTQVVRFGDGEGGERTVDIPIHGDTAVESNETVNLTLSDPRGCATLGGPTSAVLTIQDDDALGPSEPATFSIAGVVSGLAGSGLVLRDRKSNFAAHPTANGSFTIVPAALDGAEYDVVVETQPSSPLQVCTVTDGSGTVNLANVTTIAVDCTTPSNDTPGLDESFGDHGRVTAPLSGGATTVAVQPDGKIVVAGDSKLMRFNADGTTDASFGNAGQADFTFPDVPNAISNLPQGVAIQGDGRIVVVGCSESGSDARNHFVVARYGTNGTLDPDFGAGGRVIVDFDAWSACGRGVVLTGGGSIVVAGEAQLGLTNFDSSDVVVARLTASGAFDPTFGTNGRTHTHFAGATAEVHGVGQQLDGRIVVAGSVAANRGAETIDLGLASYTRDGARDTTFGLSSGTPGQLRTNLGLSNAALRANAMVIQRDGQIAVAGEADVGGAIQYLLVRISADGTAGAPILTSLTTQGDKAGAIALLPDGDLVVVGRSGLFGSSDFGIARFSAGGGLTDKFTVDFLGGIDGAQAVAVQPGGLVVVAGFAQNGAGSGLGLARVVP